MIFPLALLAVGTSALTDLIVVLSGTHIAFSFMRSRAIGYFLLTTLVPLTIVLWNRWRTERQRML